MTKQEGPTPARIVDPPDHSAETQRLSHLTTGLDVAAPFGTPPALPRTHAGGIGVCLDDYPAILTTKHLCEALHVSYNTITAELQHGSLAPIAVKIGKQYRVSKTALIRFMEGGA